MERERDATQSAQISWQASKRGLKKLHERVNNDERRNARAREKSLLERREKQSQTLVVVLFHFFLQNLHVVVLQTKHRLWWITTETRR